MNSSVKAIEWFEPMAPVESSKKQNAKPSRFKMIMPVKTKGHFFVKKIFDDVISGYNEMYVNNNCHTCWYFHA